MAGIRWPLVIRRTHKWLALFVGLQVALWTITGFYMVVVHIDTIHGDSLVRRPPSASFDLRTVSSPAALLASNPHTREIRLQRLLDAPVWKVETARGAALYDARTGGALPALSVDQVRAVAKQNFATPAQIVAIRLLTKAPMELKSRKPPFWQVEFAGWNRPTLYISPTTGEMISRRHLLWRVFDFAWMLHIMDYRDRSDVNNPLLRVATWSAFAMVALGAFLLVWSFPKRRRKKIA